MMKKLLIVEDDENFARMLEEYLKEKGFDVLAVDSGCAAVEKVKKIYFEIILIDQNLPDRDGIELAREISRLSPSSKMIFITAFPEIKKAVEAIKAGAFDYLTKPLDLEELNLVLQRATQLEELERISDFHRFSIEREEENIILVGRSPAVQRMREFIKIASRAVTSPVLITGETGTGKSLMARAIHFTGPLKEKPFVTLNCSAIPESLMESELFGYERGAFTGASRSKRGLLEVADGGTLFLDEIGDLPLTMQAKLLHVLDTGRIRPLGSVRERQVRVRIIAASNRNLEDMIKKGLFRADLYYRIAVLHFHIPPLRERKEDIQELAEFFVKKLFPGRKLRLSPADLIALKNYSFPGNIRELKNIIERAGLLSEGPDLNLRQFLPSPAPPPSATEEGGILTLEEVIKNYVLDVLRRFDGNRTKTAEALGISLSTLKRWLKKWSF